MGLENPFNPFRKILDTFRRQEPMPNLGAIPELGATRGTVYVPGGQQQVLRGEGAGRAYGAEPVPAGPEMPAGVAPPAPGPGPLSRMGGALAKAPGLVGQGLEMLRDPTPGPGVIPQVLGLAGQFGRRMPAMIAAGRGDMGLASALDQNALLMEQNTAIAQELTERRLDPMSPGDQEEIFNVFSKYGRHDMAQQYAAMLQSGNIEAMKLAQEQAALAATLAPQLDDMFKFRKSYGDKSGAQGASYEEAVVAIGRIEEAVDAYLNMPEGSDMRANPMAYQVAAVAFQKLLDPTSVVRESEYARSEEFQSILEKLVNLWVKAETGGVQPNLMRDIGEMARRLGLRYSEHQAGKWDRARADIASWGHDPDKTMAVYSNPHEQAERLRGLIAESQAYQKARGGASTSPIYTPENKTALTAHIRKYFDDHPDERRTKEKMIELAIEWAGGQID